MLGQIGRIKPNGTLRNLSAAGKVGAPAFQAATARGTAGGSPSAGDMMQAGVGEGAAGSKSVRGGEDECGNAIRSGMPVVEFEGVLAARTILEATRLAQGR